MLTFHPATDDQYEEFLELLKNSAADYVDRTLELMQLTWEEFAQLFRTVGQVWGIRQDSQLAGFYWIEERDLVLHLHGLILKQEFQRQGIGTHVLTKLETEHSGRMDAIELGVHESNEKAKRLYERQGYETVEVLDDLGFHIMQKHL